MLKPKNNTIHNRPAKAERNKANKTRKKIIVFHILHRGFSPVTKRSVKVSASAFNSNKGLEQVRLNERQQKKATKFYYLVSLF